MNLTDFINDYLSQARYKSSKGRGPTGVMIDQSFVYAYGPYMCMTPGFEKDCDEIARHNITMRLLVHAAYLIRKITVGISYDAAKKLIKDFIISVDNEFPMNSNLNKYRLVLTDFATKYLTGIRNVQRANGHLESFMTTASPIVTYNQTIEKKEIEESYQATCAPEILQYCKHPTEIEIYNILEKLLLDNFDVILMNADKYTKVLTDSQTGTSDLVKLDKLTSSFESFSHGTQVYYYLAFVDFLKIPFEVFSKHLNFLKEAGDFSKFQNYEAFESMVDEMASYTNVNIAAESWDDPTMDEKEEIAISEIMKSHNISQAFPEEPAKYDFGALNDFINVKRFMKFEEFPNRLFVSSVERARIINVNIMGADRNYYEMDNNTVACPFLDLRDYQVKVIVLYGGSNEIQIYEDINDIY